MKKRICVIWRAIFTITSCIIDHKSHLIGGFIPMVSGSNLQNIDTVVIKLWPWQIAASGLSTQTHWVFLFFCFWMLILRWFEVWSWWIQFLNKILASKADSALLPHGSIPDWVDLADLITSSGPLKVGRMLAPVLGQTSGVCRLKLPCFLFLTRQFEIEANSRSLL